MRRPAGDAPDWDLEGRRIHRRSIVLAACLGALVLLACVLHDHMAWVRCGRPEEAETGSIDDDMDSHRHFFPWIPPAALHAVQHLRDPTFDDSGTSPSTTDAYGVTAIDPVRVCPGSWVVGRAIDEATAAQVEAAAAAWKRNLTSQLRAVYNKASGMHHHGDPTTEPARWARFDTVFGLPVGGACPSLRRVGGDGDGGKLVCGLEFIPDDESCVVYSLGGNNEWDFESGVVAATRQCAVHTFDCTVAEPRVPPELAGRVVFHKICLGTQKMAESGGGGGRGGDGGAGSSEVGDQMFSTLPEIMGRLGHDRVTLLKADIVSKVVAEKDDDDVAMMGRKSAHACPWVCGVGQISPSTIPGSYPTLTKHTGGLRVRPV
jgi:hypothetical protein